MTDSNVNSFDLGRLLRLKNAIAAIASGTKIEPADAPSLTDGYLRMRSQVADLVSGTNLDEEFKELFPEIPEFKSSGGPGVGGRGLIDWHTEATTAGTNAQRLLDQLSGWIGGLIEEQTLPERIQAEAAERVKQEQGGFEGV